MINESSIKRLISLAISELVAFKKIKCFDRVLMYHSIDNPCMCDELGIFDVSSTRFEEHLSFLIKERGRTFAPLEDLMVRASASDCIYLTFDDGYKDNLLRALPILERLEVPATIFVCSSFVDAGDSRFLSKQDLRLLADHPLITIGSHGKDHVNLAQCGDLQLKSELSDSKEFLEQAACQKVDLLSYPNGKYNNTVKRTVQAVGYKAAFTSRMAGVGDVFDLFEIPRVSVLGIDSKHTIKRKSEGAWDWHGKHFLKNLDHA